MKRSEINAAIEEMLAFAKQCGFVLPPFANWSPQQWADKGRDVDEIRQAGLGWDVTDFGKGDFKKCGLALFTIRNGRHGVPGSKSYCEKLLYCDENQITPMHFHWKKTEDIINRGGGKMVCRLQMADQTEQLTDQPVQVSIDGRQVTVPAGETVTLGPGESITLTPFLYHEFWGQPGDGPVLLGEVSTVNDDAHDNRFYEPLPRYPGIEEDAQPIRLLCNEYPIKQ